jgi:hypothetical protein
MSTTTVLWLLAGIAAYVAIVGFVLALLHVAHRADEAAERHSRTLFEPSDGDLTAGEVEYLEGFGEGAERARAGGMRRSRAP